MINQKYISKLVSNNPTMQRNMITILDSILRNLYVKEDDIRKIMTIVYTSINKRNLDIALGASRICHHGYTADKCKICAENYDYYSFYINKRN